MSENDDITTSSDAAAGAIPRKRAVRKKAVAAPVAAKPKLTPKPRPLMARVGVPNSVFALGSIPLLQRR